MKRYIYITLSIVVIAVIAIALIFYFKNKPSTSSFFGFGQGGSLPQIGTQGNNTGQQGSTNTNSNGNSTNSSSSGLGTQNGLTQTFGVVADGPVLDYFIDARNNIIAIKTDGTVISVSGGSASTISSSTINNIIAADFSYDGKRILVSSGDPNNPQTNIFNVSSTTWTSAPQGLKSPQWSLSGYQFAYLTQSTPGLLSLSILDASNLKKTPVTLLSLHATDLGLQWISRNQFVLADKPTINNAGSIWVFDSQKGTMTPVVYENAGAESVWGSNTTNTLGLVFRNPNGNSNLELLTPVGNVYQSLTFLTLPSKCVFNTEAAATTSSSASSYLYCGIPADSSAFSSAQLPDAYNMDTLFTSDTITRVNIATGAEDLLWNSPTQNNIDATDLKFFNNTLFFINRYDQKLYALVLAAQSAQ